MPDKIGARISLRVPPVVLQSLEEVAQRTYRPVSAVILDAILVYLDHERRVMDVQMALHDFVKSPEGKEFIDKYLEEHFDELFDDRLNEKISATLAAMIEGWKRPKREG